MVLRIERDPDIGICGVEFFGFAAFICKKHSVIERDIRRRKILVRTIQRKTRRRLHSRIELAARHLMTA